MRLYETIKYGRNAIKPVYLVELYVSAFANTFGGALIFGISNDEQIVGLEDPKGDAEKISEAIKTRLDPIPEFKLRFHKTVDGKVLVILDVYKGDETPYYYSGDGVLEVIGKIFG